MASMNPKRGDNAVRMSAVIAAAAVLYIAAASCKPREKAKPSIASSPIYEEKLASSLESMKKSEVVVKEHPRATPRPKPLTRPARRATTGPTAARPTSPPLAAEIESVSDLLDRGRKALHRGQFSKALEAFDRAVALDPRNYMAHSHRADALLRLRRYDEALQAYQRAYEINPSFTFALHGVATSYLALGDTENALATYRRILAVKPDDKTARSQIKAIEARKRKSPSQ